MKNFKNFISETKKCTDGEYYCFTDKKCKPIPKGYRVGYGGQLTGTDEKKNGNGNGNGTNGVSNGGNGGNGGGNGGGGE